MLPQLSLIICLLLLAVTVFNSSFMAVIACWYGSYVRKMASVRSVKPPPVRTSYMRRKLSTQQPERHNQKQLAIQTLSYCVTELRLVPFVDRAVKAEGTLNAFVGLCTKRLELRKDTPRRAAFRSHSRQYFESYKKCAVYYLCTISSLPSAF